MMMDGEISVEYSFTDYSRIRAPAIDYCYDYTYTIANASD